MHTHPNSAIKKIRNSFPSLIVLAIGYMLGTASTVATSTHADIRKTPSRQAFKSGSERSEAVLREIASTVKRMDTRLARIEKSVGRVAKMRSQED